MGPDRIQDSLTPQHARDGHRSAVHAIFLQQRGADSHDLPAVMDDRPHDAGRGTGNPVSRAAFFCDQPGTYGFHAFGQLLFLQDGFLIQHPFRILVHAEPANADRAPQHHCRLAVFAQHIGMDGSGINIKDPGHQASQPGRIQKRAGADNFFRADPRYFRQQVGYNIQRIRDTDDDGILTIGTQLGKHIPQDLDIFLEQVQPGLIGFTSGACRIDNNIGAVSRTVRPAGNFRRQVPLQHIAVQVILDLALDLVFFKISANQNQLVNLRHAF